MAFDGPLRFFPAADILHGDLDLGHRHPEMVYGRRRAGCAEMKSPALRVEGRGGLAQKAETELQATRLACGEGSQLRRGNRWPRGARSPARECLRSQPTR